jgi:hypothetical protein
MIEVRIDAHDAVRAAGAIHSSERLWVRARLKRRARRGGTRKRRAQVASDH